MSAFQMTLFQFKTLFKIKSYLSETHALFPPDWLWALTFKAVSA